MHPENKLTNHGKQVNSGAQSQIPNVTQQQQQHQGPAGSLGSKGVGAGNHAAKPNQITPGNSGLKSGALGGGVKGKAKRERSVSADAPEQRDALNPALQAETKDGVMRSKRRCVLEKKQPYSGDEWCSGADSEEEEEKPPAAPHRELPMVGPVQPLPGPTPIGPISESGGPALGRGAGPGLHPELPRPPEQVVYVFTTGLANSAAEAVIHGHAESILQFHQQNVPRTKLNQCSSGKLAGLSEQLTSSGSPQTDTPKSQSTTPRPASVGGAIGGGGHLHPSGGTPSSTGLPEGELPLVARPGTAPGGSTPLQGGGGGVLGAAEGPGLLSHPSAGVSPSPSPPAHLAGGAEGRGGEGGAGNGGVGRLSREQLEHRERSLQTLRDIERLLLRGPPANEGGGNPSPGVNSLGNHGNLCRPGDGHPGDGIPGNNHNNNGVVLKKYEEPLQSMISQTQSLGGGPGMDEPLHPHLASPLGPLDMGPLLGPDGLTPEQVAWRKLQEEYYQEKRRQQQPHPHPHPYRMMPDMGVCVIRGPPPPYHSKSGDPQWGPMMGGGGGGNGRLIDMQQEGGGRGPHRFLGQMQRGPPRGGGGGAGGGYPGNLGGVLPMDAMVHQRPPRPGMGWLEDGPPPNMGPGGGGGVGGPFQMCYPPPQHLQDPERPLTREEVFRLLEKRQLQGLHRLELERLAKQGGPRMMEPPRGEPVDFPAMRAMMGSPVAGGRELGDSPLGRDFGVSVSMGMGPQLASQQQQHMMLVQKLRAGLGGVGGGPLADMLSPEELAQIRAAQNGRGGGGKGGGGGGPLQFPPNHGPFPGPGGGGYLQEEGPDVFGPEQPHPQMGGMSRLSHMPLRGGDLGPRHPSDLSVNVHPQGSPAMPPPPHQLKSPPLSQAGSPLLPPASPSAPAPVLKSPPGPPAPSLPPSSGAGTLSSSLKSPQVMGLRSPSASPAMPLGSPGWTASPKPPLPSPAAPPSGKAAGNGGGGSAETGQSLPQRSSNSTPISQPASMNPSMPFTSSPDVAATQNPLSLIMSQMSKYAMPSSTPLYHEAIKTIATSDDEMTPDRPLLPGVHMTGNMGNHPASQQMLMASQSSMGPHSGSPSPMGMVLQGQPQLSHDSSGPMLHSPNTMGIPGMNPAMMGGGGGGPDGIGPCNVSPMLPQGQLGGFSRMQGSLHSPGPGMGQPYPPQPPPEDVLPPHGLGKRAPHPSEPFHPSLSSMGEGPDLSDVIRATPTGIPEFDLSRIIPSDKPSSTLQYFPKSDGPPHLKPQPPSSNPHLANLQNMMVEQQLAPPLHPSHPTARLGGPRGGGGGMGPMCHPGPPMSRTGLSPQQQHHLQQQHQQQQAMMANSLLHHQHPHPHPHPGMMGSPQHQQTLMMMQAKQRGLPVHGDPYGPQGPLMSPQGPMMAPPHPQTAMMGPQGLRHRGMSLDSPLGYGPGGMANTPF